MWQMRFVGLVLVWLATICGLVAAQQPAPAPSAPPAVTQPAPPAAPRTTTPTPAQVALPPEVLDPIKRLSESVETAEKSIQQLKELEGELQRLRTDVERIIYDLTAAAESLRPQLAEVRDQITKLGPPPATGQPPESDTVAGERARLNGMAAALDGAVKTSELAWVRAKQLIDRITVMRYQIFTRNLFERRQSPLLPALWRDVAERMDSVLGRFRYYGGDWLYWAARKSFELMLLAVGLTVLLGAAFLAKNQILGPRQARPAAPPTFFARVSRVAWLAPLSMLAPVAAAVIAYVAFESLDLQFAPWDGVAMTMLKGVILFAAAATLANAVLAPRLPWWRLVPVDNATAGRLAFFIKAFVGVYVVDIDPDRIRPRDLRAPHRHDRAIVHHQPDLRRPARGAAVDAVRAPIGCRPARQRRSRRAARRHLPPSPLWVKLPLWLIAVLIIGAAMLGYIALARFVAYQLVMSGVVLTHPRPALSRDPRRHAWPLRRQACPRRASRRTASASTRSSRSSSHASSSSQLTFALILAALPVFMLQWGFSGADIRDYSKALLFGFEVGQFRISLARILIGIAIFIGLLFLTRVIQRWLREGMLHQQRVDTGIANSIDTAVGYGGVALAALISVSYAGFDITSLAIVAGALSVGIGFGLQSIVNNFVSGLILLVERPIKVGDWVVVGGEQGNVRRISVRSTEIETFDRASLIVPNSELISGRVLNWTHRNLLGRVVIKVSVEPNADPHKVIGLLAGVAEAHPTVLKVPQPQALLDSFGSDKLEFSLRATLSDVTAGGRVQSDLRVAILQAFREAGLIATLQPSTPMPTPPAAPQQTVQVVSAPTPPPLPPLPPQAPAPIEKPLTARIPTLASATPSDRKI